MTWITSFFVAVIASVVGLFLARSIAKACVLWYDLSYSDGASGLLAGYAGLVGGLAGLILGFISARMVALCCGPGFGKELAGALGVVLLIAGVSALRLRLFADVAPTIDGQELSLEVEFRFPNTHSPQQPPTAEGNDWVMALDSYSGQRRRKGRQGTIQTKAARLENGQWIVPTRVDLFTERGRREVWIMRRSDSKVMSFTLPLPRRPGHKFEAWSLWTPEHQTNGQPWPSDRMSCRFRVQKIPPPPLAPLLTDPKPR